MLYNLFKDKYLLPLSVFLFTGFMLSIIQVMVDKPMLMLERFMANGGWIEIFIISVYGSFIAYKMQDIKESAKWRLRSWTVFSIFFFLQLILGILVSEKFLLTGKLHIPVPAMLLSGPLYRAQLSIMSFLFLSTLVLSGPAWCSQLCYFGAVDGLVSSRSKAKSRTVLKHLIQIKGSLIAVLIIVTLCLRWFNVSALIATIIGISFGMIGMLIIIFLSGKQGKMVHCIAYCPVGTIVNLFKWVSPFRMYIEESTCTICMKCTPSCKYDALNIKNIKEHKPGITCTLCGDCLSTCNDNSIKYKIFNSRPETARRIYLFITISLHALFLAMGRI